MSQWIGETINQYVVDIVALFKCISIEGNYYSDAMQAQIFVQGL
ncbi:19688_t:CDS:2 [Racocetra fulgida]|uniref:19688_t:CDS:1 n=1 Tax=Racocetra fulgida TaxID=60492 RepID=A0A9N8ZMA6_9GLOM|nr:19688_t:CDS:2 [Racocetra fulgida]